VLAGVVAPRAGKTIGASVFERWENLLQNGVLHFVFRLNQLPQIVGKLEFTQSKTPLFWKGLKG